MTVYVCLLTVYSFFLWGVAVFYCLELYYIVIMTLKVAWKAAPNKRIEIKTNKSGCIITSGLKRLFDNRTKVNTSFIYIDKITNFLKT